VTDGVGSLADKILAIHSSLATSEMPHAFGGALALAWCTQRARGTIDIDVNVFVPANLTDEVLGALPVEVNHKSEDREQLLADGQTRLWWGTTPIDLFLDTTPFHSDVGRRVRWEPFAGTEVPFLACRDLAVFKAFFNRARDWADLEEMRAADTLDIEAVSGVLVRYLGGDDPRIERLRSLG
jgi:hypothetical protein